MSKNQLFLCATLLVVGLSACGNKEAEPAATPTAGEQVFVQNCRVCHAQGLNGAPIIGNKIQWRDRIGKGQTTLTENAINGFGLMPAKGGNTDLPDEQVAEAVSYMMARAQE